jgi:hypothetical protein
MAVTVYLPAQVLQDVDTDWDPDVEPHRYSSGWGHNAFELFLRLRGLDRTVRLSDRVPRRGALVYYAGFSSMAGQDRMVAKALLRKPRSTLILIRSDMPESYRFPLEPDLEVVPHPAFASVAADAVWLPPLPQRGLRPRLSERRPEHLVAAFKGNPENLHPFLATAEWSNAVEAVGFTWLKDMPARSSGSDHTWHDFSEIDVVVALRPHAVGAGVNRKPPTKLINAWLAGCIPIVAREPACVALGRDGDDVLFADTPAAILAHLRALASNPRLVQHLRACIEERASEFEPHETYRAWLAATAGVPALGPGAYLQRRIIPAVGKALRTTVRRTLSKRRA